MTESKYLSLQQINESLGDSALMRNFEQEEPYRPDALNDIFEDIGSFFTNTGKSAANANKITERLDKNLEKSFPYILAAGIILGAMAISQTVKNVQEIQKNAK